MATRKKHQRGAGTIEFVLVGIPMIFVLVSTFEIARGMWVYQTLGHAVKDAARYASVHGNGCSNTGNSCGITVAQVASHLQSAGPGLLAEQLSLTLTDAGGSTSCSTLTTCLSNTTAWPSTAGGAQGSNLTVTARYQFRSALCMFWPGAGAAVNFAAVNFPAAARETVQF